MPFKLNPITGKLDYYPKLDDCATPDDNTDLDFSSSLHGLVPKSDGSNDSVLKGDGSWEPVKLNEIANPDGDVNFNLTTRHIQFSFTNPVPDPDGAFEIEALGAFEGDLLHVHQHTGNPSAVNLVRFEADDTDVVLLRGRYSTTTAFLFDTDGLTLKSGASVNKFSTDGTLAGDSDDVVPTEQAVKAYGAAITVGIISRAHFTYNGGATAYTIKLNGGRYWCKDKFCFWDSELTAAAIGTPAASTDYYLYLDYSAITSFTAITATELIWSTTAPTYNPTYGMYMNGDDVCIFGVKTNATPDNILEFFHNGNSVIYADNIADLDGVDIDMTWIDVSLSIPEFARRALVTFSFNHNGGATSHYQWRTNDQTGSAGHSWGWSNANSIAGYNTSEVITDSDQIIEVMATASDENLLTVRTDGWFFPDGM